MHLAFIALIVIVSIAGILSVTANDIQTKMSLNDAMDDSRKIDLVRQEETLKAYINEDGTIGIMNIGFNDASVMMYGMYGDFGDSNIIFTSESEESILSSLSVNTIMSISDAPKLKPGEEITIIPPAGITLDENSGGYIISDLARKYPLENKILMISANDTGTGDGTSIYDALGVSLAIQNINTDGKIYYGNGVTGLQTDIRQYVGVDTNNDWAIAISNDDPVETLSVSEFGSEYQYSNGGLIQIDNTLPNILAYSNSQSMSGSTSMSLTDDGIVISGTGIRIIKLNSHDDDLLLRGTLNNADVKIVTSPLDLTTLSMSGNNYLLNQDTNVSKVQTSYSESNHRHVQRGGSSWNHLHVSQTWDMVSNINMIVAEGSDLKGTYSSSQSCTGIVRNSPCHNIGPGYTTHGKCTIQHVIEVMLIRLVQVELQS
jgi:hypothetical protein